MTRVGGLAKPYTVIRIQLHIAIVRRTHLVILLLLNGTGSEDVTGGAVLVGSVLERQLAESRDHVLDVGVLPVAILATEGVEPWDGVEQVVDDGDDDGHTNGVSPDEDNGDNVDPAVITELAVEGRGVGLVRSTGHPAEEGEDGSEGIDTENSTDKLEGWESLSATGNEDQPVLSKGNLKEEDGLDSTEVDNDTTVGKEQSSADDPCSESKQETKDDGDQPNLGQLPLDGAGIGVGVVVGNSDGSQISEESKEDDELGTDGLVEDDHGGDQVDFQVQAESDTVLDVSLHTLEDLASSLDGQDDCG